MRLSKFYVTALLVIALMGLDGTATAKKRLEKSDVQPDVTEDQREAMQTRVIESKPEIVDAALLSVLQAKAWTIDKVDRELGLIQARSLRTKGGVSPANDWLLKLGGRKAKPPLRKYERRNKRRLAWDRWLELTARIESWEDGTVRIRVTIVKVGHLTIGKKRRSRAGHQESAILDDPSVYQELFQKLQSEVSVREAGLLRKSVE